MVCPLFNITSVHYIFILYSLILCSCLLIVSLLYILFPENISLFPLISWFVLYLIAQAFTNPMFLSTNSLSIVYTFSWKYIYVSSHIVVCPLFNITSVHYIFILYSLILCSCLLIVSLLNILFPENISLFPLISWFVLYLIAQAFTNQNAIDGKLHLFCILKRPI